MSSLDAEYYKGSAVLIGQIWTGVHCTLSIYNQGHNLTLIRVTRFPETKPGHFASDRSVHAREVIDADIRLNFNT